MTPHQQRRAKNAARGQVVLTARKQGLTLKAAGKLLGVSGTRAAELARLARISLNEPHPPKAPPSKLTLLKRELAENRRQILTLCKRLSAHETELRQAIQAALDFKQQIQDIGIKKVWGGDFVVDYEKFLNALGPEQELGFKQVLNERLSIKV